MQRLTQDDYYELALLVTRRLYNFMLNPDCESPVDVVIVGADDSTVAVVSITEAGEMRNWDPMAKLLTARFPIRATITDAKGRAVEMTIGPEDLVQ